MADLNRELPAWLRGAVIFGVAGTLAILEFRRALRKPRREPQVTHTVRNLAIAAGAGVVMQIAERPLALWLTRETRARNWGVAPRLLRPGIAQTALSIAMLDYGLYHWHVLTHKIPFLWRFHLVHHIDLDLDASTALRFHFGEMLLSIPWRLAQIVISGASPFAYSLWQTLLFASILFHHSNVRLPRGVERILSFIIMTPRLHGIHHEADQRRANTNWSSGLALWDLLHGTYKWGTGAGLIGVPAYLAVQDVRLAHCLTLPFEQQTTDWISPTELIAAPSR